MYLLINLESHKEHIGDIVSHLVSTYGVPLSVTDSVEKLCPKCGPETLCQPSSQCPAANVESSSPSSSRTSPTVNIVTPPPMAKAPEQLSSEVVEPIITPILPKLEPSTTPPLNLKLTDCLPFINETEKQCLILTDQQGTQGNSHEGSPTSSLVEMEEDDDDSLQNPPYKFNPELLATFIANTPNMFAAASTANFRRTDVPPKTVKSGKERRGRIVYSAKELDILNQFYKEDPNACADPIKRKQLCEMLNIDHMRLKIWFQNRRRRDRIRSLGEETIGMNITLREGRPLHQLV